MHIVSQKPEKSAKPEKGEGNVNKKQDELERMIFFKYQLYMQTQWLFILLYSALLNNILFFNVRKCWQIRWCAIVMFVYPKHIQMFNR